MTQYVVYMLDRKSLDIEIIDIHTDHKSARIRQNSHAFELLCNLGQNYKLQVENQKIYIMEISVKIEKGWLTNVVKEQGKIIYEIGISHYNTITNMEIPKEIIHSNFYTPRNTPPNSPKNISQNIPKSIPKPPPPPPPKNTKPSWDDILIELKKRRSTIH